MYSAIYLEEASETYLVLKAICEPPVLGDWQIQKAIEIYKDYLVKKWLNIHKHDKLSVNIYVNQKVFFR